MKLATILLSALGLTASATSCVKIMSGPWDGIEGSGKVASETRTVQPFTAIRIEGSADAVLTQDPSQSVRVEADDNIIPLIETVLDGNTLVIKSEKSYRTKNHVTVYISAPQINGIAIEGSGDVKSASTLKGETTKVSIAGSGDIQLAIDAKEVHSDIAGSGDIELSGKATSQKISIAGSGNYQSRNLASGSASVTIAGSGDAEVSITDALDAEVNGSGDVIYHGNPVKVSTSSNGSGTIKKLP